MRVLVDGLAGDGNSNGMMSAALEVTLYFRLPSEEHRAHRLSHAQDVLRRLPCALIRKNKWLQRTPCDKTAIQLYNEWRPLE